MASFWLSSYSSRATGFEIADAAASLEKLITPILTFFDTAPTVGRDHFFDRLSQLLDEEGMEYGVFGLTNSLRVLSKCAVRVGTSWHPGPGRPNGEWTQPYLMVLMAEYRRLSGRSTLPSPKTHYKMPSNRQYRFVLKFLDIVQQETRFQLYAGHLPPEETLMGVLTERSKSHLAMIRLLDAADSDFAKVSVDWAQSILTPLDAEEFLSLVGNCAPRTRKRSRKQAL